MTNRFFPEIKGRFGFGCMRLPMCGEEVDLPQFCAMTDAFLDAGFNYFDTAHGYIRGLSETAIRAGLSSRHPRESFVLTDKLTANYFKSEADIRPFFESQLEACGVDYFDFYLMHAQGRDVYPHFQACRAYETALALKEEGKIRHLGISFHDKPEVLDRILCDHPEVEVVQMQFNYLDYEDPAVESRRVYETAVRHGKPVIVMEPVKGGALTQLPEKAQAVFDEVRNTMRFSLGIVTKHPITFSLVDPVTLHRLSGARNEQMSEQGLFRYNAEVERVSTRNFFGRKTGENVYKKREDIRIFVLDHLPRIRMEHVIAHELAHDWMTAFYPGIKEDWIKEGFAEYIAWRYNQYKKRNEMNRRVENNPDPVYGEGFRKIRDIAKQRGFGGLRKFLESKSKMNKKK